MSEDMHSHYCTILSPPTNSFLRGEGLGAKKKRQPGNKVGKKEMINVEINY